MKPSDKVDKLRSELASALREIKNCNHQFGEAKFDPETYMDRVPTGSYTANGSDPIPDWEWETRRRDRWSKTCVICGHSIYTTETETKITKSSIPKF